MPQLINYNIDVKTPFDRATEGFNAGLTERKALVQQQGLERQQALAVQMQADLATLARQPNAKASDYAAMMVRYPQLSEHFKRGWDTLNGEQQQNKLSVATQVYAAVNSGRTDIASQLLKDQATALRNSGKEQEAKAAETMAQFIEMDPKSAKTSTGLLLSSLMGPDKFAETFTKLEKEGRDAAEAPAKLTAAQEAARKAKADADLAEIKARYGEKTEIADLAVKGWNIKKIEADIGIARDNSRIAAMNAQTSRMNAGTQQGELRLKVEKAVEERNTKIREKVSEITSARSAIDNLLNTADQILKHPGKEGALGPIAQRMPTTRQDSANFEALVGNLDAQAFISQVPAMKGLGALSDAEGKKLSAALQSFDLKQSPAQFDANVREAQRLMIKARSSLATKYGVPDTIPDTPAAAPSAAELDRYMKQYGPKGSTPGAAGR